MKDIITIKYWCSLLCNEVAVIQVIVIYVFGMVTDLRMKCKWNERRNANKRKKKYIYIYIYPKWKNLFLIWILQRVNFL